MHRRALLVALVGAGAILAFGIGAATIDDALGSPEPVPDGGDPNVQEPRSHEAPSSSGSSPTACSGCGTGGPTLAIAHLLPAIPQPLVVGLAGAGALLLVVLWRRAGAGTDASLVEFGPDDGLDRRPDRDGTSRRTIADPPASNPVYRAWRELAERIDERDPRTTTAREYAAAARDRDLDGEAIETLTTLFRRVRYGREPVTDEHADRASRAADRLEDESP